MAVDVTLDPNFALSAPRPLFDASTYLATTGQGWHRNYDIHPDGDRFVFVALDEASGFASGDVLLTDVYLVVNWFEELKERMGAR